MDIDNGQIVFVTGGYDHTIKLWQTHTGICQRTLQQPSSQVNALAINPENLSIASASYEHIYMYDIMANNPNPMTNFMGAAKNVTDVGFNATGQWLYLGGEDCRVKIWDIRGCDLKNIKQFNVKGPVSTLSLHPNQVELFVGDHTGTIHRYDLRTDHSEDLTPDTDAMILSLAINSTGKLMAAVNNKGQCYVWNLSSGNKGEPTKISLSDKFIAHRRHGLKCEFSPDSKYLITTSSDQTAKVWSTSDFSPIHELSHENQRWVWDAAFSADSQCLFTASSDGYARLWNVNTGTMERQYSGHQKAVTALAFKDNTIS